MRRIGFARVAVVAVTVGGAALAGCNKSEENSTQVVARVHNEEITVSQLNFALSRLPPVPSAEAASARAAVLQRLIDQEYVLRRAIDQRLDRDPRVVQEIEAGRREIISRTYLEKVSQGAPKPTSAEVDGYYEGHPALFSERRIYTLQEVNVDASAEQVEAIKRTLVASKTFADFVSYLKANNFRFATSESIHAAEQLPLASVESSFSRMKDGQAIFNVRTGGAQVINLVASRPEPVSLERARPAIEQFLLNERKRKLIADHIAALRHRPTEDVWEFAPGAARNPYRPASAPELPPLITLPATSLAK